MDLVPYLSAIILISTIATILLALISYAAFKLRDKRKPKQATDAPVFFHRFAFDDAPIDEVGEPQAAGAQDEKGGEAASAPQGP